MSGSVSAEVGRDDGEYYNLGLCWGLERSNRKRHGPTAWSPLALFMNVSGRSVYLFTSRIKSWSAESGWLTFTTLQTLF